MGLDDLLRRFIETYSRAIDIQLCPHEKPPFAFHKSDLYPLPLNPFNKDEEAKREIAHYFLLVASIDQADVVGRAENARELIARLYEHLGCKSLFEADEQTINKAISEMRDKWFVFARKWKEISKAERSDLIPPILSSVNAFVSNVCKGDIIEFGRGFESPMRLAEVIAKDVLWMGKTPSSTRKKTWMYLRWMVRGYPDLRIFDHFHPRDLYIPLDINVGKVATCLGWLPPRNIRSLQWSDVEVVTNHAKRLYSEDPAKIDFPFFLLGRTLPNDPQQLNEEMLVQKIRQINAEVKFEDEESWKRNQKSGL